jgi:hypothetical protein
MRTHGYSSDELSGFYAVLDRAVRIAAEQELGVSVPTMVQRLFEAADDGERDGDHLLSAIFAETYLQQAVAA